MSLKEAYSLAHSAQCRLQIAASRPDRNLRFVVGHLMHYENLRLRIVEIEHDVSKSQRAQAVAFKGTGHVQPDSKLRQKPSTGQLGRKSPPPPAAATDEEDDDSSDEDDFDAGIDDEDDGLGLTRFPSGSAHPSRAPPDLEPDEGDIDDYEDEPHSPEEPDQETLEQAMKGDGNELMATMYEGVRKCCCHGKTDAPSVTRMWELPASEKQKERPGVTFAVAEVAAEA